MSRIPVISASAGRVTAALDNKAGVIKSAALASDKIGELITTWPNTKSTPYASRPD